MIIKINESEMLGKICYKNSALKLLYPIKVWDFEVKLTHTNKTAPTLKAALLFVISVIIVRSEQFLFLRLIQTHSPSPPVQT